MTSNKLLEKINSFFSNELIKNVSDIAIFQREDGGYELFNKYIITQTSNGFDVGLIHGYNIKSFSSLPNAVTWCIFDKRNKLSKTARIEYLDKMLSGVELSIMIHKKMIFTGKDPEARFISVAKLTEDHHRKKLMHKEMLEYIIESKNLQTKQFAQK